MSSEALAFLIIFVLLGCVLFVWAAWAAIRSQQAAEYRNDDSEKMLHHGDGILRAGDILPVEDPVSTRLSRQMEFSFPILNDQEDNVPDPNKLSFKDFPPENGLLWSVGVEPTRKSKTMLQMAIKKRAEAREIARSAAAHAAK